MSNRGIIKNNLIDLISQIFGIPKDVFKTYGKSLLNEKLGLNAIALTYLYFIVQAEFGVVFPKNVLDRHRFDSIENITDILLDELEQN